MTTYRVTLVSVAPEGENDEVQYETFVDAKSRDDAIETARKQQTAERPEIRLGSTWFWAAYPTAEEGGGT